MSGIITEQWERRHNLLLCPTCLLQLVLVDMGIYYALEAAWLSAFGVSV